MLHYDYIVKLETNSLDAKFIVNSKLKGRWLDEAINSKRESNAVLLSSGRDLAKYFVNLTHVQYDAVMKRHALDLGMYGYSWDKEMYVAKCEGGGRRGDKCC